MKEINLDLSSSNVEKITVNFERSYGVTVVYSDGSTAKHEFTEAIDNSDTYCASANTDNSVDMIDVPVIQDESVEVVNKSGENSTGSDDECNIQSAVHSWTPDVAALFLKELVELPMCDIVTKWNMKDIKEVTATRDYLEGKYPGITCVAEKFDDILNGNVQVDIGDNKI